MSAFSFNASYNCNKKMTDGLSGEVWMRRQKWGNKVVVVGGEYVCVCGCVLSECEIVLVCVCVCVCVCVKGEKGGTQSSSERVERGRRVCLSIY